ncbi:DUF2993 domain-containing protein, partial [filamentous cyanobacterium CCP5]
SPVGVIVDQLAEDAIRDQIAGAEELYVRIDNMPNFQILNGRLSHVRAAGRGIYPVPDLRIAAVDLETDTIDVDFGRLRRGELALDEPLQVALGLTLRSSDLNQFIQSDWVQQQIERLQFSLPGDRTREASRYSLANPALSFLEGDRLRIVVDLEDRIVGDAIPIRVELGLNILNGHRLEIVDPDITIAGEAAPAQLITSLAAGVQDSLTLKQLEKFGVTTRVLDFAIRDNELKIAMFARVEPDSPLLNRPPQSAPAALSESESP